MKIIDQYVEAVGRKLPSRGRADIKTELRSLLLDEVEGRYGQEADAAEVQAYLKDFGSPASVAQRYLGNPQLIAPGLVSLYKTLLLIVLGAHALAFFIMMLLNLFTQGVADASGFYQVLTLVPLELGRWLLRTLHSWTWAVGLITLIMMGISRFGKRLNLDPDSDWTPADLDAIELDSKAVSRAECIAGLVFTAVVLFVLNLMPDLPARAEALTELVQLDLGHRVNLAAYRWYLSLFSLLWLLDILRLSILLVRGVKSRLTTGLDLGGNIAASILAGVMVLDTGLYTEYSGIQGWRLVFLCMAIVAIITSLWQLGTIAWKRYQAGLEGMR